MPRRKQQAKTPAKTPAPAGPADQAEPSPLLRRDLTPERKTELGDELVRIIRAIAHEKAAKKREADSRAARVKQLQARREELAQDLDRGFELVNGEQRSLLDS